MYKYRATSYVTIKHRMHIDKAHKQKGKTRIQKKYHNKKTGCTERYIFLEIEFSYTSPKRRFYYAFFKNIIKCMGHRAIFQAMSR